MRGRRGGVREPLEHSVLKERPHTGHHEAKVRGWCWRAGPFREEESRALSEPANPAETAELGVTGGLPAQQNNTQPSQEATLRALGAHKGPGRYGPCTPGPHALAGGTDHARVAAAPGKDSHTATCSSGQINSYMVTPTAEGMPRRGAADVGWGRSWHVLQRR